MNFFIKTLLTIETASILAITAFNANTTKEKNQTQRSVLCRYRAISSVRIIGRLVPPCAFRML
ncbi:MAG TPA: hypothetical protein DCO86_02150 [Spirochaetaceae bacterium]|nr:hypothetical protein [Spirochaetaceae bacterium]